MAIPPKDNEAFFREVDEELRRDQMLSMWERYGRLLIAGVVLFLAIVGGMLWWQSHRQSVAEKQAESFSEVLADVEANKVQPNDGRLAKLIDEGNAGYKLQAMFLKAALASGKGSDAEAIAIYGRIVADKDAPQAYRDAALIRQTSLEYDKLSPAKVVERLKSLAVQGNPWFGTAGEMVGIAYLRQGKTQLATPIFVALAKDKDVPASIRQRASEVAVSMGADPGPEANVGLQAQ